MCGKGQSFLKVPFADPDHVLHLTPEEGLFLGKTAWEVYLKVDTVDNKGHYNWLYFYDSD